MMMMLGFGTRGRCKTKFRSCEGRDENVAEADEERNRGGKEVGDGNKYFFVTDLGGWRA